MSLRQILQIFHLLMSSGQPRSSLHNNQGSHAHTAVKHAMMRVHTHTPPDGPAFLLRLKPTHLLENPSCSAPGPVHMTAVMRGSSSFLVLREFNLSERGKKITTSFLFTHYIRINGLWSMGVDLRLCLMLLREQCECFEYRYGIISSCLF